MASAHPRVPIGPTEPYNPSQDLLTWLHDEFRQFGDIFRASVYGTDVYVVSDPDHVDHVLRINWQNYRKGLTSKRVGLLLGNGLMVSEGEFWKNQRRMVQPAFHDEAIATLISVITAANSALLKKWTSAALEGKSVNITSDISNMVLDMVLISIFGVDYEQVAPQFRILSDESARNLRFAQAFRPLGKLVLQVADERRKENKTSLDMLGLLLGARDQRSGQPMPDNRLVSEIMTLIVAGHETTASTLNWMWYLLSHNSAVEGKLSSELNKTPRSELPEFSELSRFTYTRRLIEETLRLYPAGWLMTRKAIKDDQLGDYFVPAGTEIYISPYLIHRHPTYWKDPDCFNPDRFERAASPDRHKLTMLPFSAGPRKCIGESLARMEMQIHLIMVAKQLRLQCISEKPLELEAGINLRSKHDFFMYPAIRNACSS